MGDSHTQQVALWREERHFAIPSQKAKDAPYASRLPCQEYFGNQLSEYFCFVTTIRAILTRNKLLYKHSKVKIFGGLTFLEY